MPRRPAAATNNNERVRQWSRSQQTIREPQVHSTRDVKVTNLCTGSRAGWLTEVLVRIMQLR